ncbi:toll/interleukin-1 receptor (TIR) domain-containing protein [Artemisia annua]|uniref:Toll/interleukin-1 receptor (TIR) domain-containing protein n=1 Tax=Artemisia annua TaxID=35608 RepID=A0A2U1M7C1_ARTAN|nr:toll/interleukin-1 receptor (TIR) domain-containing protein [Artemisia annua]
MERSNGAYSCHNNSKNIKRSVPSSRPSNYTSASSSKWWNHDVFLSFRREDTGNNFVDHLCTALDQEGILTYKIEETFPVSESTLSSHLKAIEKSQIAVIVFSKNYADSSTCLEELVCILTCVNQRGQIVIPIFYHVDPSDVRKQKGTYGEAFIQHELKNKSKVDCWREALAVACNHFGWNIERIANGHESKGIKLIVDGILKRLYPDKGLIGTHTRLEGLKYDDGRATFLASSCEEVENLKISFQDIQLVTNYFEKNRRSSHRGTSGFLYDVYISFSARDSECHIVDDIRAALEQEGIYTKKEDETQSRKESILLKAIERSRLFVIIFTKKFVVNPWYLDEVAKIIECMKEKGQFVLPVFYNMSHYDVRTQKGYFGEVMSEFDTHPRMEVWRNALVEATNAPGLEYSNFW